MDKILPVIKMPEKEPAPRAESAPMTGHRLPDMPNDNQLIQDIIEDNMAGQQESDLAPEIDGDDIIQVDERIIPSEDDVFNEPAPRERRQAPAVAPVRPLEEDEESLDEQSLEYTPKKGKRKYVRKAPMSDKQKAHLEKIRKISLEKRAQKKLEKEEDKKRKEEEKEDLRIQKAQERLLAKQKKEQAIINDQRPPSPQKAPQGQRAQQGAMFTQADMEKAMYSAISSYETIRKKEKADKKQQELANARENQMRRTLEAAIRPQAPPDPWRQFFS